METLRLAMQTYPLKEDSSLAKDVTSLHKLFRALAEELVAVIHLDQARLVLLQLRVQLVHRLRSTRAHGEEGRRVVDGAYVDFLLLLLDLRLEEAHAAGHLVDPTNLAHERALEGIDIRV